MRPTLLAAALAATLLLAALPTATAKGIAEDGATYPAGVTSVTRTAVRGGEEFSVTVGTDQDFEHAAMVICRFKAAADADPSVCWSQVPATPAADGSGFTADSGKGSHPAWDDGWVIGYKLILTSAGREAHAPATGSEYYKVVVGGDAGDAGGATPAQYGTSKPAPFCSLCIGALGIALVLRRRLDA